MKFVVLLPEAKEATASDGLNIIRAIEAQHGLLVERAVCIYSFSHLTFQEYLTARYIVQNQKPEILDEVVNAGMRDQKWREVLLYTASLMLSADEVIVRMIKKLKEMRDSDEGTIRLLSHGLGNINAAAIEQYGPPLTMAELRKVADHLITMNAFLKTKSKTEYEVPRARAQTLIRLISRHPSRAAGILGGYFARPEKLISYLYACRLLIECLEVSITANRHDALMSVFALENE